MKISDKVTVVKGIGKRMEEKLQRLGINTVEELTNKTPEDMMKVRNLGRKSLEEVLAKLKELGLQLNPSDEN